MKKTQKILILSAAVIVSSQSFVNAEEVKSSNEKSRVYLTNSPKNLPKVQVNLNILPNKYSGQPFKDISQSIFKKYINEIYHLGITTGYTATTYNPNGNVTRGEMAVFLHRLAGSPQYTPPFNVFTDIKQYKNQILWLSAATITRGTGVHYNPNGEVTRGQMAAFLHRIAIVSGKASSSAKYDPYFADAKKNMFANDIGWLRTEGITTGYTRTSFKPDASITRGEMAAFLSRFYNKINKRNLSQPVDKTSLKVKNSILYTGDIWKAEDNFVSATNKEGKVVAFTQVKVSGKVDTSQAGKYTITYFYNGKKASAIVTIKENKSSIILANSKFDSKDVGDVIEESQFRDNIVSLRNKDGELVQDKSKVKIIAKNAQAQEIELSNITKHPGTYTITYSYDGKSIDAQLTVENITLTKIEKNINELFNGEQLKENITQQMIDNLQQKLNQIGDSKDKQPLQKKLDQAQKLLDSRPFTKEIMTTEYPANTKNAGINMGNGHDRQDLGIQLEKNAKIKIKQINPKYKENLSLRLLTNDRDTESYMTFSTNEIEVTAKDLCVPFIDTPYNQENGEKPKVEVTIEGKKRELPKYNLKSSINEFTNKWNITKGYALLQGSRFQTLFPEENKTQVLATNLDDVIDLYDNEIIGFYNELIGLSDQSLDPINKTPNRRYFYKADKHGPGGLYYGGSWAAQTSSSADAWLSDEWGALHETGHGYQGSFMNKGMGTGEVWNNIYGVIYNYKHMGKEEADQNSWLYNYGYKTTLENYFKQLISSGNMDYNEQDVRKKLLILSNIIDKAGNQGLQYFYSKYREYANQSGFDASNYLLPDLLVTNLGGPKKYDFSAVLSAWKMTVKEESKQFAKAQGYQMVSHLAQVVPDDRMEEAINKLTINNRLSSVLSLVTNKELDEMRLKSNITLQFPDKELFEGTNLKIYRDNQLYGEVPLNKENITLNNMPNGVYSLELDSNVGYITQPYLFVKDNQVIKVPLVNYVKEATQVVQALYQENTQKIKTDIMQKDIDHAKEYVEALPESKEKSALLGKVEEAYNQLQEFTFRGLGNWTFATFDVTNGLATIRINSGQPHVYFENEIYASLSIIRNGNIIYNKEFIGDQDYSSETNTISLETNDIVSITHKEASGTRLDTNHSYLKNNGNGTYRYKVENGLLNLLS